MDRRPERAGSLPVDDPNPEDPLLAAEVEIVGHEILDVPRLELVKIENAVDRYFHRFLLFAVHAGDYSSGLRGLPVLIFMDIEGRRPLPETGITGEMPDCRGQYLIFLKPYMEGSVP